MKTYRVYRIHQSGKSKEPECVKVPAISQEHAIKVAMAEYSWMDSEIKGADEFDDNWPGPLWYVIDPDHNLVENKDKSLVEFALEDEARKYVSGLAEKGTDYDVRKVEAFRVQKDCWQRKIVDE